MGSRSRSEDTIAVAYYLQRWLARSTVMDPQWQTLMWTWTGTGGVGSRRRVTDLMAEQERLSVYPVCVWSAFDWQAILSTSSSTTSSSSYWDSVRVNDSLCRGPVRVFCCNVVCLTTLTLLVRDGRVCRWETNIWRLQASPSLPSTSTTTTSASTSTRV